MELIIDEIVRFIVWLYLKEAIFSLLSVRFISAACQFVFPSYLRSRATVSLFHKLMSMTQGDEENRTR